MAVSINTTVAGGASGASGGSVDIASMTSAATVANSTEKTDFLTAVGAAQYLPVRDETGSFTLSAANHSNRRTDASSGSAIAVTWDTGHGMTTGDTGRIVQTGAGAVTISAGTGTLTLSPNVTAAATTADGSWIDWEYLGSNELLITARGVADSSATLKSTPYSDGLGTQVWASPGATEFTLSSITIPANKIGANGWVQFIASAERTAGVGNLTLRIRLGNATTGTQIATPAAGSRVTFEALLASLNSTSSHRSGSPASNTIGGPGVTVTDTTASTADITFYLTGQLATGTDTLTRYYFKAIVHNPDA